MKAEIVQQNTDAKKKGRVLSGVVVSDKMKDTVVVEVSRFDKHPKYGKYIVRSKKYKADDKGNTKKVGDKVQIKECPPISKDKHFRVVK
jgi:small subunit ribosomal protein S17